MHDLFWSPGHVFLDASFILTFCLIEKAMDIVGRSLTRSLRLYDCISHLLNQKIIYTFSVCLAVSFKNACESLDMLWQIFDNSFFWFYHSCVDKSFVILSFLCWQALWFYHSCVNKNLVPENASLVVSSLSANHAVDSCVEWSYSSTGGVVHSMAMDFPVYQLNTCPPQNSTLTYYPYKMTWLIYYVCFHDRSIMSSNGGSFLNWKLTWVGAYYLICIQPEFASRYPGSRRPVLFAASRNIPRPARAGMSLLLMRIRGVTSTVPSEQTPLSSERPWVLGASETRVCVEWTSSERHFQIARNVALFLQ
jgi:hypothetical protein